jgi:hypothetical protein
MFNSFLFLTEMDLFHNAYGHLIMVSFGLFIIDILLEGYQLLNMLIFIHLLEYCIFTKVIGIDWNRHF